MKNLIFIFLLAITIAVVGCDSNDDDQPTLLEGTKWKLAGIVDVETGNLKVLEPEDCDKCYTLTFDTKNTFTTNSASNGLSGNYKVDYEKKSIYFTNLMGTERGELGDGNLWWSFFYLIEYFSLQENELKLYYNENFNYLFFKQVQL